MKFNHLLFGCALMTAFVANSADLHAQSTDTPGTKTWRCDGKPDTGTSFALDTGRTAYDLQRSVDGTLHLKWDMGATAYDIGYKQEYAADSGQPTRQIDVYTLNKAECIKVDPVIDSVYKKTIVREDRAKKQETYTKHIRHLLQGGRQLGDKSVNLSVVIDEDDQADFMAAHKSFWSAFSRNSKKGIYPKPATFFHPE